MQCTGLKPNRLEREPDPLPPSARTRKAADALPEPPPEFDPLSATKGVMPHAPGIGKRFYSLRTNQEEGRRQ